MNRIILLTVALTLVVIMGCATMKNQEEHTELSGVCQKFRPHNQRYDMDGVAHSYDVVVFLIEAPAGFKGRRVNIAIPSDGSQIYDIMVKAHPHGPEEWKKLETEGRRVVFQVRSDNLKYYFSYAKDGDPTSLLYADGINVVRVMR